MTADLSTIRPARVQQTTSVEQSRAVAEVAASVAGARANPRDVSVAVAAMREACSQRALAERAFFAYPRAGERVTGPSVHLARELARCWGNMHYGFTELAVDHDAGISELIAYAWDIEANVRNAIGVQVPHRVTTKKGTRHLDDPRDIYENNANNASRRLRQAILSLLPGWYLAEAEDVCRRALSGGGTKTLAQRAQDIVTSFGGLGVTREQVEAHIGRPVARWTEPDLVHLIAAGRQIRDGETSAEELFPTRVVSLDELQRPAANDASGPAGRFYREPEQPVAVEPAPTEQEYDPTAAEDWQGGQP